MLKNHEAAESPFMLPWVTSVSTSPRIHNFIYKKILPAQGSVLVLCTKINVQIGAVRHVSHPCYTIEALIWRLWKYGLCFAIMEIRKVL